MIINTDKEIYKTLFDEIEKINKELHEYELIKQYICNDDLTSKIYKNNIIPQIQQLINSILATFTTYQIEIHYDKDEIEIYKKENGSDTITNIDTCGGFERHTLNLLFRMIFSQISGLVRLNFLIIDECIDSCDINNKEKIKNIINYMKSKYKWGMIISHDYYVKDNFDKELTIQHINDKPYINV
jgi:DNA repair exonuclease SbcCD ATPase subunit